MNYKELSRRRAEADKVIIQIRSTICNASTLSLLNLNQIIGRELIQRKHRRYDEYLRKVK